MPLPTTTICHRVSQASWRIVILRTEEPHDLLSFGSAFAVSPKGLLLTARHVISDGKNFYASVILGLKNGTQEPQWFAPITAADHALNTGARETKPFAIDVAALAPVRPLITEYLPLRPDQLEVGEEIIAAGYAKDITSPFYIEEHVDSRTLEGLDLQSKLRKSYGMRQLFFKKTMVGARWKMILNNYPAVGVRTEAHQYIYGTDLVEGASGGPVVDMDARVAAVISRKGVLPLEKFDLQTSDGKGLATLPTGSGTAFSHNLVTSGFSATDQFFQ